jgi:hypothetical protein
MFPTGSAQSMLSSGPSARPFCLSGVSFLIAAELGATLACHAWKIEPELVNFLGQAVDRTRYWTPGPATIRAEEPENPAAAIARRLDPRETVSACLPIVF